MIWCTWILWECQVISQQQSVFHLGPKLLSSCISNAIRHWFASNNWDTWLLLYSKICPFPAGLTIHAKSVWKNTDTVDIKRTYWFPESWWPRSCPGCGCWTWPVPWHHTNPSWRMDPRCKRKHARKLNTFERKAYVYRLMLQWSHILAIQIRTRLIYALAVLSKIWESTKITLSIQHMCSGESWVSKVSLKTS